MMEIDGRIVDRRRIDLGNVRGRQRVAGPPGCPALEEERLLVGEARAVAPVVIAQRECIQTARRKAKSKSAGGTT